MWPAGFRILCTYQCQAGGGGIGRDFDIFQKIAVKFPTPGKNVRSNITKFPTPRNDLWSQARTKIQISLPPGQNDRSKSRPMPHLPPLPAGLTLIGALRQYFKCFRGFM